MELKLSTSKRCEMVDITGKVEEVVGKSGVKDGICHVFVPHATAAVSINENYDPNVLDDFLDFLEKQIPRGRWRHDSVDGNGDAHIKSCLVGPSEVIPVRNGKLLLGTWQNINFCEFDGPRSGRRVVVSVISA